MVSLVAAANKARYRRSALAAGIPLVCDLEAALAKFGILLEDLPFQFPFNKLGVESNYRFPLMAPANRLRP
jgi:hypothetical protein